MATNKKNKGWGTTAHWGSDGHWGPTSTARGSMRFSVKKDDNVSMRRIENGFVVRHSGFSGKGANKKYFEKEFYCADNPIKFGTKKLK